jgi:uncharacterized protein (DUF1800 family)
MSSAKMYSAKTDAANVSGTTFAKGHLKTTAVTIAIFLSVALMLAAPFLMSATDKHHKDKKDAEKQSLQGLPTTDLTEDEAIAHALNRLGYGPRPGDIEHARQIGLAKWIEQQLHPESLDDSALNPRLDRFPTLDMSSAQLEEEFPQPRIAAKREGVSLEEYKNEQQAKQRAVLQSAGVDDEPQMPAAPANSAQTPAQNSSATGAQAQMSAPQDSDGADADANNNGASGAPNVMTNGKQAKAAGVPANAMMNYQNIFTPQRVVAELAMAKTDRAIYSERQLYEQMVDFWFNHFNVYAGKGADKWLLTSYERDSIRPYAMGKFRDLLEATAKSPAMLFYLDNWQSVDPAAWKRLQQQQQMRRARNMRYFGGAPPFGMPDGVGNANPKNPNAANKQQERGLNENYGRELMELHTLGVDGGYTQQDVIEVARAFTGWSIRKPQVSAEFFFDARLHDDKPKKVLGHKISGGGMKDGEEVLDLLASDPHTAQHLSFEIAQHFVSDNPPQALVDRMAKTYLATDGDIRAVLHTMIYSPEFWSRDAYRAKIKTPFELVVSAARAVGADVDIPLPLVQWVGRIGEPLYQCQPPTGYSSKADAWVNTGALLSRLNYTLTLASNHVRSTSVNMAALLGATDADRAGNHPGDEAMNQPMDVLNRAITVLLSNEISDPTRQTLEKQLDNPQILQASLDDPIKQINRGYIAGLVLGAPEFQRR